MSENFAIERSDTIDFINYDEKSGLLQLHIIDGMDWEDRPVHMKLMIDKLNNYLLYIDTKQFEEKYPETKRIEILIRHCFDQPDECMVIYNKVSAVLENLFENSALIVEKGDISK